MSQKSLIDMAADRGAFICQSQSLNLFIARPDHGNYFYALLFLEERSQNRHLLSPVVNQLLKHSNLLLNQMQ